jgi:hypothetical protein
LVLVVLELLLDLRILAVILFLVLLRLQGEVAVVLEIMELYMREIMVVLVAAVLRQT